MIKLENTEVLGWEHAIRGMRNPMNSWGKGDSFYGCHGEVEDYECDNGPCGPEACCTNREYILGPNDHDLMMRLAKGGPVHAKYRRMITVYVDITAPLYWWKEFDTYKVGTVANSCSTMHKIAAKEFTLEDFSCEHLMDNAMADAFQQKAPLDILYATIDMLNLCRRKYLGTKSKPMKNESARKELMKKYWWQMIQLLPSSYNQKRTVMLNYEVLTGIYPSRKNHKLDEWHTFCDWIVDLPYSEIITGMSESEKMVRIGEKLHEGFKEGLEAKRASEASRTIRDRFGTRDAITLDEKTGVIHEIPSFDIDKFPQDADAVTLIPGMEVKDEANICWVAACDLCNEHGCGDSDEEVCKKCHFYQYSKWTKEENVGPNDGLNKHFGGVEE